MADEYQCDHCKRMVDTIYFYRPLCEKCYREQKDNDKNECGNEVKGTFISDGGNLGKEVIHTDLEAKPSQK